MKIRGLCVVLGLAASLLVACGIAAVVIWLRIQSLKNRLAEDIGQALDAKVEVASLALDLGKGELDAVGITLANQRPGAPWDRGEIGQAVVRFHLLDFFGSVQPLEVEVSSWRVVLRPGATRGEVATNPETSGLPEVSAAPQSLAGHGMEVTRLTARDGDVEIDLSQGGPVLVHGVSFEAANNGGGTWTTHVEVESVAAGSLQAGAGSVDIRADAEKIVFAALHLACGDTGMISGDGEIASGGEHEARAHLQALDLPVTMLVAAPWQMKLSGLARGNLSYSGDDRSAEAQGDISVSGGRFNVLPFLGRLAQLVGLPDITNVDLDKATADFTWKDHALHLSQIDVRKNDAIRVGGEVDVDAAGQIDGRLKLGLPDTVASRWPQLQTAVFSTQAEDYSWTDVHLTGTPDHLQEDLTPRLLAAGLQSGSGLINQGTQKAMDLLKNFMGP